jgi:GntR family transcriptional regulator
VVARRLRLADRETMAIETLHVREALVPGLEAHDLEGGSFYELLRARYGIVIAGGAQTIEPTVTNEEESEALGVPLHSPAFLFERVTRSESGEIVEFVHSIYRGDRYRLVTDLTAVPSPRRPALSGAPPPVAAGQDHSGDGRRRSPA